MVFRLHFRPKTDSSFVRHHLQMNLPTNYMLITRHFYFKMFSNVCNFHHKDNFDSLFCVQFFFSLFKLFSFFFVFGFSFLCLWIIIFLFVFEKFVWTYLVRTIKSHSTLKVPSTELEKSLRVARATLISIAFTNFFERKIQMIFGVWPVYVCVCDFDSLTHLADSR